MSREFLEYCIDIMPPSSMRYKTVGDWQIGKEPSSGPLIQVADLSNDDFNFLIGIHELVEAYLCYRSKITTDEVDAYDFANQDDDDPGLNSEAPYHKQHMVAFAVEILLANVMGIDWIKYIDRVDEVWEQIPKKIP